jgi:uncharacterized protein YcfL
MKKTVLVVLLLALSGCAHWDNLSEREQQTVVIAGSILATGFVIAHSNDTRVNNYNCISTRSLRTGCSPENW